MIEGVINYLNFIIKKKVKIELNYYFKIDFKQMAIMFMSESTYFLLFFLEIQCISLVSNYKNLMKLLVFINIRFSIYLELLFLFFQYLKYYHYFLLLINKLYLKLYYN